MVLVMEMVEKGVRKQEVRSRHFLPPAPQLREEEAPYLLRVAALLSSFVHASRSISWDYEARLGNLRTEEVETIFFHANKEI
jgi:hypothetical protein